MSDALHFYIDGEWTAPASKRRIAVVNPATEEPFAEVAMGDARDVDRAVAAAKAAFADFSRTTPRERAALFRRIVEVYRTRLDDITDTVTREMGAPLGFSRSFHAEGSIERLEETAALIEAYPFEELRGSTLIAREPIGVVGAITPWNAPVAALVGKIAPALAAGCTIVAKPSEIAPLSPLILAEILHEAGVPKGVFNLVTGDGPTVGQAICAHPDVDMVTFTGSTRAGILVAKTAADTVKRVIQELGGKSANIVLPDADLEAVVGAGVRRSYVGSGQSCQAPTRLLVHASQHARALEIAAAAAEAFVVGDPLSEATTMGPVASGAQFAKVQELIQAGIDEGATLVTGGTGRPGGLDRGYFVKPTVFGDVRASMRIAREEIFGPVLSILPYATEDEAIALANDSDYGLAGWVYSADIAAARRIAARMRTGRVYLNGAPADPAAPFGGYKRSGNGREGGVFGLESYLEIKAVLGCDSA